MMVQLRPSASTRVLPEDQMNPDQFTEFLLELQASLQKSLVSVEEQLSHLKLPSTTSASSTVATSQLKLPSTTSANSTVATTATTNSADQMVSLPPAPPLQPPPPPPPVDPPISLPQAHQECEDGIFQFSDSLALCIPGIANASSNDGQHADDKRIRSLNKVASFLKEEVHISGSIPRSESKAPMPAQWGLIFEYSWEEHEDMALPRKLEVVRNILDIRAPEWEKRIRIKNKRDTGIIDIMNLRQDEFPVTVTWAWIQKEDFVAHSWWARLEFYWIGLTDNLRYRSILLRLTSRLKIISQEARALFEEMLDEEDEALDEIDANRTSAHEHVPEHAKTAARQRHTVSCKVTSGTYHDLSKAEDTLRDLEALLQMAFTEKTGPLTYQSESTVSTDKLFLMAGCPFEKFVEIYIRDRDKAFASRDHRRRDILKVVLRASDMVDVLCGYLSSKIDQNDQLLFKLALMFVNLVSVMGQLIWADYIKQKPLYVRQIDQIFKIVTGESWWSNTTGT